MKRNNLLLVGIVCVGCAVTACNKDDNNSNNNNMNLNQSDVSFLQNVSMANAAEIGAAQLAVSKAQDSSVRQFGQHMIDEHGMAQTELKVLADSLHVTVSSSPDQQHQALMQQLSAMSGRQFDSAYINSQVMDHRKVDSIFRSELTNGMNQAVKNYDNKYLPHIDEHLQRADSLASKI